MGGYRATKKRRITRQAYLMRESLPARGGAGLESQRLKGPIVNALSGRGLAEKSINRRYRRKDAAFENKIRGSVVFGIAAVSKKEKQVLS